MMLLVCSSSNLWLLRCKMKLKILLCVLLILIIPVNGCQKPCLFVSNTTNILSIKSTLDQNSIKPVVSNLRRALALDVHVSRELIFWSDVSDKSIKRANIDGSNVQVIVKDKIGVCDGLAVEWSSDLLYWTDTSFDKIEVARLDGSRRRVLISANLHEPRGIAVDPVFGYMFWTDWGSSPKIERAFLNGENRQAIISSSLGWPNDIALDHTLQTIYWVDAKENSIETADYSGTNRRQLFYHPIIHPFGVALLSGWLYWTDWKTASGLHQMNKTTGILTKKMHILSPLNRMGFAVFDSSNQPPGSNDCQQNNGGCSFLCLLKPDGYSCLCPNGTTMKNDTKTCSTTDTEPPRFTSCPGNIVRYAGKNRTAKINWIPPNATDNSAVPVKVSLFGVSHPPIELSEGAYHVTYTATDQSNNTATCSFSITVKVINCSVLNPNGVLQKTGCANRYGGTCNFTCPIGYRLVGMAMLSCLSTNGGPPGVWDKAMPRCEDVTCPSLGNPKFGSVTPSSCLTTSKYNDVCQFTCSSGFRIQGTLTRTCASDGKWTGQNDAVCQDIEPPRKVKCPQDIIINSKKQKTEVFFPKAVFKDNVKVTKVTTDLQNGTAMKWGDHQVTYTAFDQSGNTAKCIVKISIKEVLANACQRPRSPANGALACYSRSFPVSMMYCTVHCNKGYKFVARPKTQYSCTRGKWFIDRKLVTHPKIPGCSAQKNATIQLDGTVHYLTTNCSEQNTHPVISKFVKILMADKTGIFFCAITNGCKLENVRVTCGDTSTRRRRSTVNLQKLNIDFKMKIRLQENASSDSINATLDVIKSSVFDTVNKRASKLEVNGLKLTLQSTTLKVGLKCLEGQVLKGIVCAGCPPGYYMASSSQSCSPCSVNHFQEDEGKTSCVACPSGATTGGNTGSKSCSKEKKVHKEKKIPTIVVPVLVTILVVLIIICALGYYLYQRHKGGPGLANEIPTDKQLTTMSTDNPLYESPAYVGDHSAYATISEYAMSTFQNNDPSAHDSKA